LKPSAHLWIPAIRPQIYEFLWNYRNGEKSQDWLAVAAVSRELFSDSNSLLTGKFTGNIASLVEALRYKSPPESALAGKTRFSRPIGTGNDQGMNRERNSLIQGCRETSDFECSGNRGTSGATSIM
jgi:hypothetical protein